MSKPEIPLDIRSHWLRADLESIWQRTLERTLKSRTNIIESQRRIIESQARILAGMNALLEIKEKRIEELRKLTGGADEMIVILLLLLPLLCASDGIRPRQPPCLKRGAWCVQIKNIPGLTQTITI